MAATSRDAMVIELYGLHAAEVRDRFPTLYRWVHERAEPEREQHDRATYRDNWWLSGEHRQDFLPALARLPRFIAIIETAKR